MITVSIRTVQSVALDLHVLGTPPAFILSQDQTLHKSEFSSSSFLRFILVALVLLLLQLKVTYLSELTLTYCHSVFNVQKLMERVRRIELPTSDWKSEVLPLNYTRVFCFNSYYYTYIIFNSYEFLSFTFNIIHYPSYICKNKF